MVSGRNQAFPHTDQLKPVFPARTMHPYSFEEGSHGSGGSPRVLRVSHSAVVQSWRQREREMQSQGAVVNLVTAARWNEGGSDIAFDQGNDAFAVAARTFGSHPNFFLYAPGALWRMFSREWDVLDFHEEPYSLATAELLLMRALRARRVPYVLYSAQNIAKRFPPPFRLLERFALRRAAGAYPCNSEAGKIMRQRGLRGALFVLPLGVDTSMFVAADRQPPRPELLRLGYVGRLTEAKGIDVLVDAIATERRMTLEVVGHGTTADALVAQVRRLAIADRVRLRGFVAQEHLPEMYREFDVVVIPSVPKDGWTEQFCRVAVEAMASGVPIVASRTGALPEVVGTSGLLVTPGDAGALRLALRRLHEDPLLWKSLRDDGLARANDFAWPKIVADHLELYRSVMTGARRG